ncbi:MAG: hypothetical protein IT452_14210 [Planctomycetia bacterium]|nr:hypothetical protein [Planctomycetia bacterium]
MGMAEWPDGEEFYAREQWSEFISAAETKIAAGWSEPAHWWTMLANAYQRLGRRDDVKRALETGVRRHPTKAVCHAFLGTYLAEESAGKPDLRELAILHWRKAIELERRDGFSTFDHYQKEIDLLLRMASADTYPPVRRSVRDYVAKLKDAGFFREYTESEVLARAQREFGADLLRAKGADLESYAELDPSRHLSCDWRFSALDLLQEASNLVGSRVLGFEKRSEGEPAPDGVRSVTFMAAGAEHTIQGEAADDFLAALNEILRKVGVDSRIYKMSRCEGSDGYEFLVLNSEEAAALQRQRLIRISALVQRR